jgi:hypothetical protein
MIRFRKHVFHNISQNNADLNHLYVLDPYSRDVQTLMLVYYWLPC